MVVFWLALTGLRGQVLWYGLGLAVWGALDAVLFPTVRDTIGAVEYPEAMLEAFGAAGGSMADPRTFFDVEFFSLAPLIVAVFALFASTGALAGEESAGTMELLASFPLSRRRVFAQKALAVALAALGVVALVACGWVVTMPFVDLGRDLTLGDLVAATFTQLPFAAFMIAAGLFFGAVAPSRSAAAASTAAVLIASYLFVLFAALADAVEPLKYVSPYYYADLSGVLADGAEAGHQAVLWLLTAIAAWLALRGVEGREFGAERWQFGAILRSQVRAARAAGEAEPPPSGLRAFVGVRRRSRRWWAGAGLLLILAGGAAGAALGYGTGPARERVVTAEGRVDAEKVNVLAPASGLVRLVMVAEGDDVQQAQAIGWMVDAFDGSVLPVRAPIAGRVTRLGVQPGQVQPAGTVFAVVYALDSLHIVLEVDEADIDEIVTGQQVAVTFTALGLTTTTQVGSVAAVPLSAEAARSGQKPKYEVKCPLPAPDSRLTIGMRVDARISVAPAASGAR